MRTRSRGGGRRGPGRPGKGAEPRLTRRRILEVAVRVIDQEGAGALGIRKLAARLGVAPNALYSYIQGKDDVIRGAIALLFATVTVPPQQARSWKGRLRETCVWFRKQLLQHPNVVAATGFRESFPFAFNPVFIALGTNLRKADFEDRRLIEACFSLSYYTIGFVTLEVARQQRGVAARPEKVLKESISGLLEGVDLDDAVRLFPFIKELDLDAVFRRGLDSILEGLAADRRRRLPLR